MYLPTTKNISGDTPLPYTSLVRSPGVTSVKVGDHVIPLYTPECRECKTCLSQKSNLCTSIRSTQGQGLMPDGTRRFSLGGQMHNHNMGRSEEHTSELRSLMRISYAVFCLKKIK